MEILVFFIALAVAVFQLILLLKVWKMTNDVRDLRCQLVELKLTEEEIVVKSIISQDPNVQQVLFDSFYKRAILTYKEGLMPTDLVAMYKKYYDMAGIEMPEDMASIDNVKKLGIWLKKRSY